MRALFFSRYTVLFFFNISHIVALLFPAAEFAKVFGTDDCCGDKQAVQESLRSAAVDIAPISRVEPAGGLPPLTFPAGKMPKVIQASSEDSGIASHAISLLIDEAKSAATQLDIPGISPALGFDAEWEVWTSGPRPVATVQLATVNGTTVIFHVKYGRKQIFPAALRRLLEREDILKVRSLQ